MDVGMIGAGLVFGLAAMGSGFGIGIVGPATVGAWKKCYLANKPAPMTMLAFTGNPLTQVFYGYLLMNPLRDAVTRVGDNSGLLWLLMFYGLAAGLALFFTALIQGKIAACACEAMAEKNQGFAQYMIVMGIAETVALFAMVFTMLAANAVMPNVTIPPTLFG
ncbi:MAG: V-type ATP synthase subunit K [Treponema sp.]|nr:V-type ATP synthase subunit K [Treponema sp.]